MKNLILFTLLTLFSVTSITAKELEVPKRPQPQRMVNILSQQPFLTAQEIDQLEQKLVAFSDSTSNQITIVVVDDLNGLTAYEFATEIGQSWGVGQKKKDNGIVVLLSLGGGTGNRDYFIAVGYGLEGAIPDLAVKRIQEKELLPYLKTGQYYEALNNTTDVLMALAKGEYNSSDYTSSQNEGGSAIVGMFIIFGIFILLAFLIKKNKGGGGNRGGGFSDFVRGAAMGSILNSSFGSRSSGSFGGGGGGFGGFGGGSFGGGGAGGKW